LTQVEPGQAYSETDIRLTLVGDGFIPATTLDPTSGSRVAVTDGFHARMGRDARWAELDNLVWQSTGKLEAWLPQAAAADLPTGYLDVTITDPRGQGATLTQAFDELGPDVEPPTVTFTSPAADTPVGPGTILRGRFHASDGPLGALDELSWTYSEAGLPRPMPNCPPTARAAEADCDFQVKVGTTLRGGELVQIVAAAVDASAAQNRGEATLSFTVRARPTVQAITPSSGGSAGGTDVVLTGTGFLPGSQAILEGTPLFPEGGIVIDENTMSAHVPAHKEGSAAISVRTPLGDAIGILVFTYLPAPLLETIEPNAGVTAGHTPVTLTGKNFSASTQIYFGATLDSALPLAELFVQSDTSIIGRTPAGSGATTVWAFDEALGFTRLANAFTWRNP
jgi:hypothetical protein